MFFPLKLTLSIFLSCILSIEFLIKLKKTLLNCSLSELKITLLVLMLSFILQSCSSFKAKRDSAEESDELAMEITDQWVAKDTEIVIGKILAQMKKHKGFKKPMGSKIH